MKALTTFSIKALFIILFIGILSASSQSQVRTGAMSLNAGMAMPSGLTLSAAIPTSFLTGLTFTYSFATSFGYVLSDNLQLEAGIGYVTASFSVPDGETANQNQSLFSLNLGAKYFISAKEGVMPYIGVGFSTTSLPSTTNGNTTTSASLTTILAYFGAQGFLNNAKTVALFIQFGLGYNNGSQKTVTPNMTSERSQTNINFGGSAFGGSIYF